MKSIIPSLHLEGYLKNESIIIAYILRHYLSIPSGIYETFYNEEVSFSKRHAEFATDIEELKTAMSNDLERLYSRHFTEAIIDIDISDTQYLPEDDIRVSLVIDITIIINETVHRITPSIEINDNGSIKINNI
jgi:hypothetical protein